MAVPARVSASDPGTDDLSAPEPDPAEPRPDILVTEISAMRAAVQELARHPGSRAALETARLNLAVAERLGALFRRLTFDEQLLERERRQAYREGVAACMAARCRLELVPDCG